MRPFSGFSDALVRDRNISWCAVGVLTYLLRLPGGARATVRTLAGQCGEGRDRIAAALRELEELRYLRWVVRRDGETGRLSTVYEVFDAPCEGASPTGESEKARSLTSGESAAAGAGPLPGEPPSTPGGAPEVFPTRPTARAVKLLLSLGRTDYRLTLTAAEALWLAPLVEERWALGASSDQVRAAVTADPPSRLYAGRSFVEHRLRRGSPAVTRSTVLPVTTVEVNIRRPGASVRAAVRRGGELVRALLRGRAATA